MATGPRLEARPEPRRPTASRDAPGALILGAEYRALGVARSLGRHGIRVGVVQDGDDTIASQSRYVERSMRFPESDEARLELLAALALDGLEGWTLFPSGDETAALVARNHRRLAEAFVLTTPPWDVFRWAYDKRLTYRLAASLGLDTPSTWYASGTDDLERLDLAFPAILKPAVKTSFNRLTAAKAWQVDSRAELNARFAEACELIDPDELMIQELVAGGGEDQFSYAALCDEGEVLADIVARRTRQFPPDFGRASTFVESFDAPEIVEPSQQLLREMRFDGLIEVEFKRDSDNRKYQLLDANPRVWGWHTLGAPAGVDFAYLAWRHANGRAVQPARGRPGMRWVRLSTDLPTSVKEILGGRLSARAYARSLIGNVEGAIFARDDPVPGLLEAPLMVRTLVRRLARGNGV